MEGLPAPQGLAAIAGRGQVTLRWPPVPGAVGYQVLRDGEPLDHFGGDVLAVPHPPYADTTGEPGRSYEYAVAAFADAAVIGAVSEPVTAASHAGGVTPRVTIDVSAGPEAAPERPWTPVIGSEHLSHLLSAETTGGRPIGTEFAEALALVHSDLGVRSVRAHGILGDDLGVYREIDGRPAYDFSIVDEVYDRLLELGLRPLVELSFMPRDLASDPNATVFAYAAVVSPPKDWQRWADLIEAFVRHLADRYGEDEVSRWPFEVWNEANLTVFWSGTRDEWLRLYDETAYAVKKALPAAKVGGPSSAAAGLVGELLAHVAKSGAPLDFISTHTYGSPPLDFRPLCAAYGRADLPILWTEWGVTPTHFAAVNDSVFAATFLLRGMRSAAGRVSGLSYWVASDHFEELGRPPGLLHGGFGLLTVGNLRKPRYWALHLLNRLGGLMLPVQLRGDGAESLVEAWASVHHDGRIDVLVWNGTLDQSKVGGAAALERRIVLRFPEAAAQTYRVRHWRVDEQHSNLAARWEAMEGGDWPTASQWNELQARDVLDELSPPAKLSVPLDLEFGLPMPGISYVELTPV